MFVWYCKVGWEKARHDAVRRRVGRMRLCVPKVEQVAVDGVAYLGEIGHFAL